MTAALKCPCCGKSADHLAYKNVEARGAEGALAATVIACPKCDLVLGASIAPSEYVAALLKQMRRLEPSPAPTA